MTARKPPARWRKNWRAKARAEVHELWRAGVHLATAHPGGRWEVHVGARPSGLAVALEGARRPRGIDPGLVAAKREARAAVDREVAGEREPLCSVCVNRIGLDGFDRWKRHPLMGVAGCKGCPIAGLSKRLRELNVAMVRAGMTDASRPAKAAEALAARRAG